MGDKNCTFIIHICWHMSNHRYFSYIYGITKVLGSTTWSVKSHEPTYCYSKLLTAYNNPYGDKIVHKFNFSCQYVYGWYQLVHQIMLLLSSMTLCIQVISILFLCNSVSNCSEISTCPTWTYPSPPHNECISGNTIDHGIYCDPDTLIVSITMRSICN